ncbi:spermatogenesis-associated protein 21 isoform X5 [Antechinus flavipes]|uniref:spermatogenesis-associated protein 21 isoform X5 n=1 Tax=Antechinus flavipes TaxID=38775 RepID=UPI0022362646|nr:spermatogenesis-associated protein 21 isoform X5 [Antechinus flavipes]
MSLSSCQSQPYLLITSSSGGADSAWPFKIQTLECQGLRILRKRQATTIGGVSQEKPMGGKEIGEPSRAQMGEGRTTKGRGKNLRARLAWCEGAQVQRLAPSQTPIPAQGQQLAELDGVLEPPVATGRRNVNYSRERVPKITPGVGQMVLHILSLISEQDRTNLKGRYPWLDSIGGSGTSREQVVAKSQTGKHSDLFQAREQEAGAGGARGRLTTLAPGGSEQTLGRGEAAEKGPFNDRAKGRRPRSGAGAGKDSFRSEKDRTEYISVSASASTTMSVQGCEVKAQPRSEKSAKGCHENQEYLQCSFSPADRNKGLGHGLKKTRGGGAGLKSGMGSPGPNGEEQGLGHGFKKSRNGNSSVKSGVESSGEEQVLVHGCKKTRGGSSGVKNGMESIGEEQGLSASKKSKNGGSAVKSGAECASPSGEEQGSKKTRGGGTSTKSGMENAGPGGEEQGQRPGYKKSRGSATKSAMEKSSPSGEEQGLGYKKTRNGGSAVKSGTESSGPSVEEQLESPDQAFLDQQTEDKELVEKELAGPDHMGQPGTPNSQDSQVPQNIWIPSLKAEEDSEQLEDNTPDQSIHLRSEDDEGSSLLPTPLPMERASSNSSYTQRSPTPLQPEVGEEAPKAQLVQSPAVPPIHRPGKIVPTEKDDREEETDEDWKEEEDSFLTWQLQAWGSTSWRSAVSLNLASSPTQASNSPVVPSNPEKNWKKAELHRNLDRPNNKTRSVAASTIRRMEAAARPVASHIYRKDSDPVPVAPNFKEWKDEILTQKQEEAFRDYFKFFCGPGEIDIHSLKNILSIVGISRTQTEMADVLISADVNGDGHVDFRDFLSVLTDSHRFCRSVEQNNSPSSNIRNPHTLFFEILSQLVEMLALPETSLEEITNYYQKKMKCMSKYKEHSANSTRQPHPHKRSFSRTSDITPQEQKVLNIMDRIKRQNHSTFLQSPYAPQATTYPLCPRLDKKGTRRRQGSHVVLEEYKPIDLTTDFRTFFQMGTKGGRKLRPALSKWFPSMNTY